MSVSFHWKEKRVITMVEKRVISGKEHSHFRKVYTWKLRVNRRVKA